MEETLYNLGFERSVLATVIFEPSRFEDLSEMLKPEDFYLPAHASIFWAMGALVADEYPIDEEFIKKRLLREDRYDETALIDVLTTGPIPNLKAYASEVKTYSLKRRLMRLSVEIKKTVIEEDLPTDQAIDEIQQKLYKISMDETGKDFREAKEVTAATLDYIAAMKERGNSILVGMDTGFTDLNKMTAGFGHGDLVIIAARPSMGKTAFVLNIAAKVLDHNQGVAIFSLEMPAEQLMLRMMSAKASIALQDLRVGNLTDEQWSKLSGVADKYARSKLFVDDEGNLTITALRSKLRKLKERHPEISCAVIDYLQLMSGTGSKDRHQEVSEISRGLKLLARELNIPILALSQLNRSLESRNDKRPMLSDIRESGSIEQDADIILFVYRDDVYRRKEEMEKEKAAAKEGKAYKSDFVEKPEEEAEIIVGKNRNGPTGHVKLVFHKRFTRFENGGTVPVEVVYQETKIDVSGLPRL